MGLMRISPFQIIWQFLFLKIFVLSSEAAQKIDPCQRQAFSHVCPGEPGAQETRSQFVLRYYRRGSECVSYPYGHCRKIIEDPELYKYKEECEKNCMTERSKINAGPVKIFRPTEPTVELTRVSEKIVFSDIFTSEQTASSTKPPSKLRLFTRKNSVINEQTTAAPTSQAPSVTESLPSVDRKPDDKDREQLSKISEQLSKLAVISTDSEQRKNQIVQPDQAANAVKIDANTTDQTLNQLPSQNSTAKPKSKCEVEREDAQQKNSNLPPLSPLTLLVPLCTLDGEYDDVQCDERLKVCWCTEEDGSEIPGSRVPGDLRSPPSCADDASVPLSTGLTKVVVGATSADPSFPPVVPTFMASSNQQPGATPLFGSISQTSSTDSTRSICGRNTEPLADVTGGLANCLVKPCPSTYKCVPFGTIAVCCEKDDSEFGNLTDEQSQTSICGYPKQRGECTKYQLRFYFDQILRECRYFFYSGCGGNANNFKALAECQRTCHPQVTTKLSSGAANEFAERRPAPVTPSPFQQSLLSFISQSSNAHSIPNVPLTLQPLASHSNLFQRRFTDSPPINIPPAPTPPAPESNPENLNPTGLTQSAADPLAQRENTAGSNHIAESSTQTVNSTDLRSPSDTGGPAFASPGAGPPGVIDNGLQTPRPQLLAPEAFTQQPLKETSARSNCGLPTDVGPCSGQFARWFFNPSLNDCQTFTYGGCQGNGNNFGTKDECLTACKDISPDVCLQPEDPGECSSAIPRWRYIARENACGNFVYSGCGGNGNNFATMDECDSMCKRARVICPNITCDESCIVITKLSGCQDCACLPPEINNTLSVERAAVIKEPQILEAKSVAVHPVPQEGIRAATLQPLSEFSPLPGESVRPTTLTDTVVAVEAGKTAVAQAPGPAQSQSQPQSAQQQQTPLAPLSKESRLLPQAESPVVQQTHTQLQPQAPAQSQVPQSPANSVNSLKQQIRTAQQPSLQLPSQSLSQFVSAIESVNEKEASRKSQATPSPSVESKTDATEKCLQPLDPGPCKGPAQERYWFNVKSHRCEQFRYGGCAGNNNHFYTAQECEIHCARFFGPLTVASSAAEKQQTVEPTFATDNPPRILETPPPLFGPQQPLPVPQGPLLPAQGPPQLLPPPDPNPYGQSPVLPVVTSNPYPQPPIIRPTESLPIVQPTQGYPQPQIPVIQPTEGYPQQPAPSPPQAGYPQPQPNPGYNSNTQSQSQYVAPQPPSPYSGPFPPEPEIPRCPNNEPPMLHPDNRPILCLPGKNQCPPSSSCYFNGLDYACCPETEDPYAKPVGYGQGAGSDDLDENTFGGGYGQQPPAPYSGAGPASGAQPPIQQPAPAVGQLPGYPSGAGPRLQNLVLSPASPTGETLSGYSAVTQDWRQESASANETPRNASCDQPLLKGPCRGSHLRWFYDRVLDQCRLFYYGGCKGNRNNFETQAACKQFCSPGASGTCPDNSLPLGGQSPLICGSSNEAVSCPAGFFCTEGTLPVCCLETPKSANQADPPVGPQAILGAPQFLPKAPGHAPNVAHPRENTFTRISAESIKAKNEKLQDSAEAEVSLGKASILTFNKTQHYVLSSFVQAKENLTKNLEIGENSTANPYGTTGVENTVHLSGEVTVKQLIPENAGPKIDGLEEVKPWIFGFPANFLAQTLSPTSNLACPDGAEPVKNEKTGKAQDCTADEHNNPLCPKGQYCHIDQEQKQRFCCDISSRAGFGAPGASEESPAQRALPGSDCLGGRCRPITQTWFKANEKSQEKNEEPTIFTEPPRVKNEISIDALSSGPEHSKNQEIQAATYNTQKWEDDPTEKSASSAQPDVQLAENLARNYTVKRDDSAVELEPTSKPPFCSLPPKAGAECPNSQGEGLRTNLFYYFDPEESSCKLFFYNGCDGNENRFTSRSDCLQICNRKV